MVGTHTASVLFSWVSVSRATVTGVCAPSLGVCAPRDYPSTLRLNYNYRLNCSLTCGAGPDSRARGI